MEPSQVSVKTAFTVCVVALLVVLGAYFVVVTRLAWTVTVAAALAAAALHHVVDWLTRHRVQRGGALAITLVGFLVVLTAFLLLIVPTTITQGAAFVNQAPTFIQQTQHRPFYRDLERRFQISEKISSEMDTSVEEGASLALRAMGGVLTFGAAAFSSIFLVAFMLIFGPRLIGSLLAETLPERRDRYESILLKIYKSVGGYVGGLGLICFANATITTTFLAVTQEPFFLPLGILSGLSSLVPYAGPMASAAAITLIVLATKGFWAALATMIYFLCYGQIEGQLIGPMIFRRTVNVNPLITFLSVLFLAEAAGVIGAVVAVPTAAAVQIILKELLADRRERLKLPPPLA